MKTWKIYEHQSDVDCKCGNKGGSYSVDYDGKAYCFDCNERLDYLDE